MKTVVQHMHCKHNVHTHFSSVRAVRRSQCKTEVSFTSTYLPVETMTDQWTHSLNDGLQDRVAAFNSLLGRSRTFLC